MKKIQLADTIGEMVEERDSEIVNVIDSVKKICDESNLNYIKLNKAIQIIRFQLNGQLNFLALLSIHHIVLVLRQQHKRLNNKLVH